MSLPQVPNFVLPKPENITPNPYFIALLVDNVLVNLMNVDGQTAAAYLSNPTFVQVTGTEQPGMKYNPSTKEFTVS